MTPFADQRVCEVHGFKLEKDTVNIIHGLPVVESFVDEPPPFPHANTEELGGCEVSGDSPKFTEVLYCRACRAAKEQWQARQRRRGGN